MLGFSKGREYLWKGKDGMRSLEIVVPLPVAKERRKMGGEMVRMLVRPKDADVAMRNFEQILDPEPWGEKASVSKGLVVAVRTMAIDISPEAMGEKGARVGMAERSFSIGMEEYIKSINIWEETGESIARHIWYAALDLDRYVLFSHPTNNIVNRDAGLVLSGYLLCVSKFSSGPARVLPPLLVLEKVLKGKELNVLELGAGCGIVGISLAIGFADVKKLLLTDLPEATEIIQKNISSMYLPSSLKHQVLDWSSPLPSNVSDTKWDLVVVADCTYNPDVVPDLVQTLKRLAEGNKYVVVLLAMKVRHESEMVFFDLMKTSGFDMKEKCKIPLPVLGGEDEEIEIFLFGYGG